MRIVTESGAVYTIEHGMWSKNTEPWERVMWAHCIDDEDLLKWHAGETVEHLPIQVGKKLCIGSLDLCWRSTNIVSIDE